VAVVVIAATTGCTHHRTLADLTEVEGKTVTIETTSGAKVDATAVAVPGGIQLHTERGLIPPNQIGKVTDVRHLRGAGEGFLYSGLTGVTIGAIIGFADGDDKGGFLAFSAGEKAFIGGFLLGGTLGFVGLLVGAITGSTFEYSAEVHKQAAIKPVGPRGSVAGMTITF
jgi:hypothetical protein